MTIRIRHIIMRALLALAACFVGLALHSCTHEGDPLRDGDSVETVVPGDAVQIGFRIRLGSDYGDPTKYVPGTGFENYIGIDENDFRVLLFDGEGKFKETMTVFKVVPVGGGEHPTEYTVLSLLSDKPEGAFSIAVLANWGLGYHSGFSAIDFNGKSINDILTADWARFEALDNFQLSVDDRRLIPLYGFASFENMTFTPGEVHDLGNIGLLRAMAKVEVNLEGLPDGVTLEGAPLIRGINPGGFCAPLGPIGTGGDWETDYVTDVHLPFPSGKNHPDAMGNMAAMFAVDNSRWIAYLPEFRNIGAGEDFSRIEMKFSHLDEPFIVNFARYENGRPDNVNGRFDIRRNDLYRFDVRADLHEILFNLTVEKWEFGGRTEIEM